MSSMQFNSNKAKIFKERCNKENKEVIFNHRIHCYQIKDNHDEVTNGGNGETTIEDYTNGVY